MGDKDDANQEKIAQLEALRDRLRGRVNKLNNRNRISNVLKIAESWLPTSNLEIRQRPAEIKSGQWDL